MTSERRGRAVAELASHVGGRVRGEGSRRIESVAALDSAGEGQLAFVEDPKLLEGARASRASCLVLPLGAAGDFACAIEVERPKLAFALIAELLHPPALQQPSVHPAAVVSPNAAIAGNVFIGPGAVVCDGASLGAGTQIHAGAFVGERVQVGPDCIIYPHVVLYEGVALGARVRLHAGTVIGADGFGYVPDEKNFRHKFPQVGTVVIEDDVEIGANSCVDRGALGATRIGRGTKIDNLVQIAHNVQIGERVVIAAQTGISGSTVVEDDAIIGGQVGMGDHARVESGAVIGSKAGILPGKIVRAGVWWGIPVQPLDQYKRLNAHVKSLPRMREELKELRERMTELLEKMKGE